MILVIGSTGNTGSALVRLLHEARTPFRALTRNADRARSVLGADVTLVEGDVRDPAVLDRALDGVDAVYMALGGTPELEATEIGVIDAAARHRVARFVKLSGVEVEPAVAGIQRIHARVERHLVASGLPATILGGNFFYQNFLGMAGAVQAGVLPLPTGDGRAALVDARDIARVAAVVLREDGHAGRRYRMTGPDALSHGDAAAVFSEALRRPVTFVDLPPEAFEAGMRENGLPGWFAAQLADIYTRFFGTPGATAVHDDIARITGTAPRSLASFVAEHRAAFAAG
jgi:uncharacterized protein YbjT (DUF2867 family)